MATRAEARRRKILENSEDRLKRLTGRLENDTDHLDVMPEQEKKATRAEERRRKILENSDERLERLTVTSRLDSECDNGEKLDKEEKNGHEQEKFGKKADQNNKDLQELSEMQGKEEDSVTHNDLRKTKGDGDIHECDNLPQENQSRGVQEGTSRSESIPSREVKPPPTDSPTGVRYRRVPVSGQPSSTPEGGSQSSSTRAGETSDSAEIIRQIEVTRLISCVLVAMLSRWFLPTLLGYLVLQSSAIAFIAMEVALFAHQRQILQTVVLPHKNNLMAGALLLCGIKPELITTYNRVMGIASTLFEDLMVYFFTFITCHLLVS